MDHVQNIMYCRKRLYNIKKIQCADEGRKEIER